MTAKSVLLRLQGLRPRACAPTCPLATPLLKKQTENLENWQLHRRVKNEDSSKI